MTLSEKLRKNPAALRAYILLNFNLGHPSSRLYSLINKAIGDGFMEESEFEYWFKRFEKGNFNLNEDYRAPSKPSPPVEFPAENEEPLKVDEKFVRSCILYEVLNGKEFNEIYEKLENHLGKENIDYPDFDFWYYRFKNGGRDIDYDRDSAPKSPTFSELSVDVVQKIIEKLPLRDQVNTRRVSRNLRALVDKSRPSCLEIQFTCREDHVFVKFDEENLVYTSNESHLNMANVDFGTGKIRILRSNLYPEMALQGLLYLLKNPLLKLEFLNFRNEPTKDEDRLTWGENSETYSELMKKLCENLKGQRVSVKKLALKPEILAYHAIMEGWDEEKEEDEEEEFETAQCFEIPAFFEFLGLLRPGFLEKVSLELDEYFPVCEEDLVELEQWKQAKEWNIDKADAPGIEHFLHFDSFDIRRSAVYIDELVMLRDALIKSKNFKTCTISTYIKPDKQIIKSTLGLKTFPDATYPDLLQFPIPNSNNEILEFEIKYCHITIRRKNCFTFLATHFKDVEFPW